MSDKTTLKFNINIEYEVTIQQVKAALATLMLEKKEINAESIKELMIDNAQAYDIDIHSVVEDNLNQWVTDMFNAQPDMMHKADNTIRELVLNQLFK